jgi:hypothetical protein
MWTLAVTQLAKSGVTLTSILLAGKPAVDYYNMVQARMPPPLPPRLP